MPITPFQKDVLHLLAAHRQPESHLAGGAAINRSASSPRYSEDLDFFHDLGDSVFTSAEADTAVLTSHGYEIEWMIRQPLMHRARIKRSGQEVRLDWCFDSAFRFFPIQPDPDFGYCLHPADLATNKALAIAGRSEIRDFIDILYLHETYLGLGAICWAASGKDQGLNPYSILGFAKRHMKFRDADLAAQVLAQPIKLTDLKEAWLEVVAQAEDLIARLPAAEVGCLYLTPTFTPVTPDPASYDFATLIRHFGSLRGAWPVLA